MMHRRDMHFGLADHAIGPRTGYGDMASTLYRLIVHQISFPERLLELLWRAGASLHDYVSLRLACRHCYQQFVTTSIMPESAIRPTFSPNFADGEPADEPSHVPALFRIRGELTLELRAGAIQAAPHRADFHALLIATCW